MHENKKSIDVKLANGEVQNVYLLGGDINFVGSNLTFTCDTGIKAFTVIIYHGDYGFFKSMLKVMLLKIKQKIFYKTPLHERVKREKFINFPPVFVDGKEKLFVDGKEK